MALNNYVTNIWDESIPFVPPSQNHYPKLLNDLGCVEWHQLAATVYKVEFLEKKHYICTELIQNDMNLRDIKKDIEYVIGAFIDDCSLFSSVNSKADDEALGGLLDEAVNLFNDLKDKVNMKGEGKKGAYYASIRKELLEKTDELYAKLSDVVKKSGQAE